MERKCRQQSHMQETTHAHANTHTTKIETQDGTKWTSYEACSRVQSRVHSLDRTPSQPPGSATLPTAVLQIIRTTPTKASTYTRSTPHFQALCRVDNGVQEEPRPVWLVAKPQAFGRAKANAPHWYHSIATSNFIVIFENSFQKIDEIHGSLAKDFVKARREGDFR